MSYCKKDGKDVIIFATKEDHIVPSTVKLPPAERPPGIINPDGSVNFGCPCLGGVATGPCGIEFREAFSCFHYSNVEPKGSDCVELFSKMQKCMSTYPKVYGEANSIDPSDFEDEDEKEIGNINTSNSIKKDDKSS